MDHQDQFIEDEEGSTEPKMVKPPRKKNQTEDDVKETKVAKKAKAEPTYYISDGSLWMANIDEEGALGKPTWVSRRIEINSVSQDVETGQVTLYLEYDYKETTRFLDIPREMLTSSKIGSLQAFGLDAADEARKHILRWLRNSEQSAPLNFIHTQLGFAVRDQGLVFLHAEASDGSSIYSGPCDLGPAGTHLGWDEGIRKFVIGRPATEMALCLGFVAPLTAFLSRYSRLDTVLFHLAGDSSTGKTSAAMLAVSGFGNPSQTATNGLLRSWDASDVGVASHARGIHGLPLVFDEASLANERSFTAALYRLASGNDKSRLSRDGSKQDTAQWSGAFLSTGERSVLEAAARNTGLQVRFFEFSGLQWTESAEHADSIRAFVTENYGHAGPLFAESLIEFGHEAAMDRWQVWSASLAERLDTPDRLAARVCDKLALVALTAELLNEIFSFDIDVDAITELLLQVAEDSAPSRDLAREAHDYIWERIARSISQFVTPDAKSPSRPIGRLSFENGKITKAYIYPGILKQWLQEGKFQDSGVVLRAWKSKGWLDAEHGKNTRKKTVVSGMGTVPVVSLAYAAQPEENFQSRRLSPPPLKRVQMATAEEPEFE